MSLLIVGSVAFDSIETAKESRERILGGSANYASIAASLFSYTSMVGVVGEDYPKDIFTTMNQRGIDTTGVKTEQGETFSWGGVYSEDFSERKTLFTNLNVFENFNPVLSDTHRKSEYLLLGNIHPALQLNVLSQLEEPKITACDTMNLWINTALEELRSLIQKIDILLVNDEELKLLSGNGNISTAAKMMLKQGPRFVIVKKGADGAAIFGEEFEFHLPAYPVKEVHDPTGAGDTFAGALMAYIAMVDSVSEDHLKRAMVTGAILASFCVEEFGVEALLKVTPEEINQRFDSMIRLTRFDDTPLLK